MTPLPTSLHRPDVWLSHPTWFVTPSPTKDGAGSSGGTQQSRITCKDQAHQTDPPAIQACLCSRFPKGLIVSGDADQIELRTAGLLSGEPFYLDAFAQDPPFDVHSQAALTIWGRDEVLLRYPSFNTLSFHLWKTVKGWKKRERQVGKRRNFAALFRAGADKMQASVFSDIGEMLPLSIFQKIVDARPFEMPVLWEWQERLIREARTTGRVSLPLTGISRSFLGGDEYDINEIVNFPVQATASSVIREIQSGVHRRIRRHRLSRHILVFLNIYDAVVSDCASPSHALTFREFFLDSLREVQNSGYWARLQDLTGNKCLLGAEFSEHQGPPPCPSPPPTPPSPTTT